MCRAQAPVGVAHRATGSGSNESAAACSARHKSLFIIPITLTYASRSSTARSDDMPRVAWLLTAPLLIPIVDAI